MESLLAAILPFDVIKFKSRLSAPYSRRRRVQYDTAQPFDLAILDPNEDPIPNSLPLDKARERVAARLSARVNDAKNPVKITFIVPLFCQPEPSLPNGDVNFPGKGPLLLIGTRVAEKHDWALIELQIRKLADQKAVKEFPLIADNRVKQRRQKESRQYESLAKVRQEILDEFNSTLSKSIQVDTVQQLVDVTVLRGMLSKGQSEWASRICTNGVAIRLKNAESQDPESIYNQLVGINLEVALSWPSECQDYLGGDIGILAVFESGCVRSIRADIRITPKGLVSTIANGLMLIDPDDAAAKVGDVIQPFKYSCTLCGIYL